ncbi:PEP-CTERM sorting domain-containing protein [Phenylobacterium sp.]|uniref:PEP-CTERM sorting domain-containing protein n=1 Tax=Phenylobacterium sp. TaxID=1871053 RepID=UPI0025FBB5F8|nr:PEP-CTERM sorting domain-containing protein [Phenylobacterium sp.]
MRSEPRPHRSTRRVSRLIVPAIAVVVCWGAAEARAAVVTGAFSGLIDHGTDYAGVFGPANAALDGLEYVQTFTYDTSKGFRTPHPIIADQVSAFFPQEPVLTYSLTINGITDTVALTSNSFVAVAPGKDFRLGGEAFNSAGLIQVGSIAYGSAFGNLDHPVSFLDTNPASKPFSGFAQKYLGFFHDDFQYFMIFDTRRVDFVGSGTPSAAPEPATWGMMLAGFFAMGVVMRRRAGRSAKPASALIATSVRTRSGLPI